jgi:CRISPR-associated protein Csb3
VLTGAIVFRIDWFCDEFAGGSRFKTWAGQQSVLDITTAMHQGMAGVCTGSDPSLWNNARGIGLPFNFDSDLGGQGSALDIGFSFDPLAGSEATRIEGICKPALEFLCFVGLQRFRPREISRENRFVYTAWNISLSPSVASAVACDAVNIGDESHEFKLLYRTKYLKSFLPSIPFQGDRDE